MKLGFIKMKVIDSLKREDINRYVDGLIDGGSKIVTDKSNSYNDFYKNYHHEASVIPRDKISTVLPWVHITISDAKRLLLDIHHKIDDDFLQSYLNEFCLKFNRRYFDDIFDRLLIAWVNYRWDYLGD